MKVMPEGYGQVNWFLGGTGLPLGAQVTLGIDVTTYGSSISALANELSDIFGDEIMPNLTNSVSLQSTLVKYGPAETGPSVVNGTTRAGGVATAGMSPNVAYLIRKNTSIGGRAGRGRAYVPGVAESVVDAAGVVLGSSITDLTGDWNSLRTRMLALVVGPVLLHDSGAPVTSPTAIDGFTCDSRVATQRRRLRK